MTKVPMPSSKRNRRFDGQKLEMLHHLRWILLGAAVLILVFCVFLGVSKVDGQSMMNTLRNGDLVFYTRQNSEPERGSIVSVRLPSGEYYIKRVIGIAGDTIDIRDGCVYVNGVVETGSYILGSTLTESDSASVSVSYPLTLQDGEIFVLGDNREGSLDSRYYGTFRNDQIRGVIHASLGWLYLHFY